jgi:cytochrome oxidase Cu insertion factor (SCO1/SenC/PrrC family)
VIPSKFGTDKIMFSRIFDFRLLLFIVILLVPLDLLSKPLGGNFQLTDSHKRDFSLDNLKGSVVLMFFGYTTCPDICPTELSKLSTILNSLGPSSRNVKGLFVSLDPNRDSPEKLKDYARFFHKDIIALTGKESEVEKVAKMYGVSYSKNIRPDGNYFLDHSANLYILDQQGEISAVAPYGFPISHALGLIRELM